MTETRAEYKIDGRPATIFRTVKNPDNPYVMIDRRPIDNPALSYKAKGILAYLLSRPNGWEVNLVDLANRSTDGIASVRAGVQELKDVGHLKHTTIYDPRTGKIITHLWEVYEAPYRGNQTQDTPPVGDNLNPKNHSVDKPHCGKSHASSIKYLSNTELSNIKDIKQYSIFEDHFRSFNGQRERDRWGTLVEAIGKARAEEIATWAERKEIHMTNRGGLMDSLETAAKKWTEKPGSKLKGDRAEFLKALEVA
jgi:hypothetical protein